ncbi:MAG: cupin-like domain-containing protein [Novosphingobium sp.]|nr:cupin-like domain-containing protein [Novosphingobium sp.]
MPAATIARVSANDTKMIVGSCRPESVRPLVIQGAVDHWPASTKWSFEYFRTHHYDDFGRLQLDFHGNVQKLTKLGTFIDNLDDPLSELPGFWLDKSGKPLKGELEFDPDQIWSFHVGLLDQHPEMLQDIQPFPAGIPNLLVQMPQSTQDLIRSIVGSSIFSIYISRKGTVTPFHIDHSSTHGCLVQFAGRKQVYLAPKEPQADPGKPDFDPMSEEYAGDQLQSAILQPGEMLLIPPDWWHWTKALDHSITLSHNYFSEFNLPRFLAHLIANARELPDNDTLKSKIEQCLEELQ